MVAQSSFVRRPYNSRVATPTDLPQLRRLLDHGSYVHTQLDWWSVDDWIGSPAFVVAASGERTGGLSLAVCEESPVAWWRALAIDQDWDPSAFLRAILAPTLDGLRQLSANALTCMAFSDWLENDLPSLGFNPLTKVITLRKDDRRVPSIPKNNLVIRPITAADTLKIVAVDHAAFDPTWRYGLLSMSRMWAKMSHAAVAEQHGEIMGYACGEVHKTIGHVVRLAVHPAHQGKAIGALLLADSLRALFAAGAQAVTLNTQIGNTVSQKLYRRFNFEPARYSVTVWQRQA